jgi:hypothetical protein
MESYENVFNRSIENFNATGVNEEVFESFRSQNKLYAFIDNGDYPLDIEADSIAKNINISMWSKYKEMLKDRIKLGYNNSTSVHSDYTNLDSRHIMMFVILFTHIPLKIFDSIVEIGGGFGNWLTMNRFVTFRKWSIIDLPHVSLLQNWFLSKQGISPEIYETISAFDYDEWALNHSSFDLVIGTHSVSEFSYSVFLNYFKKVISKSKYFFYCYHNTMPSRQLIVAKLNSIELVFEPIFTVLSESNNVTNCLYKHKFI